MNFNGLKKFHQFLLKTETALLVILFLSMIVIAVVQIVMRNFLGGGLIWAGPLVRVIVLWIALMGAMIASRNNQHIAIDVVVKKLPERHRMIAMRISHFFTAIICFVVAWYSFEFILVEYEYGGNAFANIPNWLCEAIIPFAFFIISIRYFIASALVTQQTKA